MLASRLFFSEHAFRKRIKCPVEYVLGAAQAVSRRYDPKDADYRPLPPQSFVRWLAGMGQTLFAPPNVKGWPGGRTWLNTATVLERDNFAAGVANGTVWLPPRETLAFVPAAGVPPPKAFDPARVLEEEKAERPEDVVRVLLDVYVPGGVRPDAVQTLVAFVAEGNPTGVLLARRVREAVHAILTIPEFQLA
jgi:hypothetical protein